MKTKKNCANCAHRFVCMYCNNVAELLAIIKRGKIQLSITDDNLGWAIEQTKKAIGENCKCYLKALKESENAKPRLS